jgi:hypothetical protein
VLVRSVWSSHYLYRKPSKSDVTERHPMFVRCEWAEARQRAKDSLKLYFTLS